MQQEQLELKRLLKVVGIQAACSSQPPPSVHVRGREAAPLQVRVELLPLVEELKYLGVLFRTGAGVNWQLGDRLRAPSTGRVEGGVGGGVGGGGVGGSSCFSPGVLLWTPATSRAAIVLLTSTCQQ